ncbi:sigma-70 family RNA polymerase sigma factor [Pseudomonas sp. F1_0610]|uniref:sigma-70 family RNA polymerase sigma factor n=1 Tax=Pseudomonas sp. F1_0610 TaxID=3114284 RepID=UPI0039C1F1C2
MPVSSSQHNGIAQLYHENHSWLTAWLNSRLGNHSDASDIAQDTFMRLLTSSKEYLFSNTAQARVFLKTTAKNLCINQWHRQEIERAWLESLAHAEPNYAPSTEEQAVIIDALEHINTMLRDLPEKVSHAFILAVICQMTDKEVAIQLGVTDRSVRNYVAKGMLACLKLKTSWE